MNSIIDIINSQFKLPWVAVDLDFPYFEFKTVNWFSSVSMSRFEFAKTSSNDGSSSLNLLIF